MKIDEYDHINFLVSLIAKKLNPLKIYLFGSFAEGKNKKDSDYDFYVIVPDDNTRNLLDLMTDAQRSVRHVKQRPVDVLVNNKESFERLKNSPACVESEVEKKGIVLYG